MAQQTRMPSQVEPTYNDQTVPQEPTRYAV